LTFVTAIFGTDFSPGGVPLGRRSPARIIPAVAAEPTNFGSRNYRFDDQTIESDEAR